MKKPLTLAFFLIAVICSVGIGSDVIPIPNRMVVLTFDDSVKSHFTVVRPILKQHGFGATFYITEGFDFPTNKTEYMTWDEIAQLHRDGFEIGNHTQDHMAVIHENLPRLARQLQAIDKRCAEHGIPRPITFAYPGNAFDLGALPILSKAGIQFARRGTEPELPYEAGSGIAYQPGLDHALLIPTAGDARPDWEMEDFVKAVKRGQGGRIAVLQFHGVPDTAHPWVHTPPEKFKLYMNYLAENDYTVIAMRDLAKYVHPGSVPFDPELVIKDRQHAFKTDSSLSNYRTPENEGELQRWLTNMFVFHRFTPAEMVAATGLSEQDIASAIKRFELKPNDRPSRQPGDSLTVLPYPGGRHPRIGFLDGEMRPQRETKFTVFAPWDPTDYFVLDIPEAIWVDVDATPRLLYLAHTHLAHPTIWDDKGITLPKMEWSQGPDGELVFERRLPDGVCFGTRIRPTPDSVRMEMWITNGSDRKLTGMRVQNCVMLKSARDFNQMTKDNKILHPPYATCRNSDGTRWIITAWRPCLRPWGNDICPCLHSDPKFPDCEPGETQHLVGWFSFFEGQDIETELKRIDATGWYQQD